MPGSSEEGCTCRCMYTTYAALAEIYYGLSRFDVDWHGLRGIGNELNYIPCHFLPTPAQQKGLIDIVQVLVKFVGICTREDVQSVVRWMLI